MRLTGRLTRGNQQTGSGVYCHLLRGFLGLLCSLTALAQAPPLYPLDAAVQDYWKARNEGHFDQAAAKREEARALLAQTPPSAPQFAGWLQNVYSLYQNGGMYARARSIAEDALARTGSLGESIPIRVTLLNILASSWQEDRNLLKAVAYMEKAVAAQEAAPPDAAPAAQVGARIQIFSSMGKFGMGPGGNLASSYQRLADLYQQLGRPDAAAATMAKVKGQGNDNGMMAQFYERQGKFDNAAAIYQQAISQSNGDASQKAGVLQQLANLYQRQQKYPEAVAALEQAVAVVSGSGDPSAQSQSINYRQNLAGLLRQAGQTDKADQIYHQLLAENQGQSPNYENALVNYANYLNSTSRGEQAENMLKDYSATHPQMEPWMQTNFLFTMASSARQAGSPERASEYQRAAEEKNRAMAQPNAAAGPMVAEVLRKAQAAANNGKLDEAFSLALQGLEAAPRAADGEQIGWMIPNIASSLALKHAPAQAEQLYQQLFAAAQNSSAENMQPLLNAALSYPRFLMLQKDRMAETPQALDRLRSVLVTARGPETGHQTEALRLTVEYERLHGSPKRALIAAQDLLAVEEGLSGPTSAPVLEALATIGGIYEAAGDYAHGLSFDRHAVSIADLVLSDNNSRRALLRMQVALNLAHQGQFDDAESAAAEAITVAKAMQPSQETGLRNQLKELERLKTAPAKDAPKDAPAAPGSKWFSKGGDPGRP